MQYQRFPSQKHLRPGPAQKAPRNEYEAYRTFSDLVARDCLTRLPTRQPGLGREVVYRNEEPGHNVSWFFILLFCAILGVLGAFVIALLLT